MSETVTRFPRRWTQSEQIGELTTTFTGDFNIAEDISGLKGVRSTFATAFNEWKDDVRYMANLAIVTNMKCWEHYGSGNEELSREYGEEYHRVNDWVWSEESGFTKEERSTVRNTLSIFPIIFPKRNGRNTPLKSWRCLIAIQTILASAIT